MARRIGERNVCARLLVSSMALWLLLAVACMEKDGGTELVRWAQEVEQVTGHHTRVVWVQDATEAKNDVFAVGDQLRLMVWDSRDGRGERVLLEGPGNFLKPLFSPDGREVFYSVRAENRTYRVSLECATADFFSEGMALATWRDPHDERAWVYVGRAPAEEGGIAFSQVVRVPLDDATHEEVVWQGDPIQMDNFQLSADGRRASGLFPWPEAGVAFLSEQRWERVGRGCWTGFSPDNAYRLWIFDGAHRNLLLTDLPSGQRWTVPLSQAPGVEGNEVYHPRWSNHPRMMVMTGPYRIRSGGNNIRGGGASVEVYLGRFDPHGREIEAWAKVTDNDYANFYPDVWVEYTERDGHLGAMSLAPVPPDLQDGEPATASVGQSVRMQVRLVETSHIPEPADIVPYTRGLVAHAYEVVEVEDDADRDGETILIAHWVIRDARRIPGIERETGALFDVTLVRYDEVPELEGERLSMDVENPLWPLYYAVESQGALEK